MYRLLCYRVSGDEFFGQYTVIVQFPVAGLWRLFIVTLDDTAGNIGQPNGQLFGQIFAIVEEGNFLETIASVI
jgi:hypothetical protein